jgi:hypothetical protein
MKFTFTDHGVMAECGKIGGEAVGWIFVNADSAGVLSYHWHVKGHKFGIDDEVSFDGEESTMLRAGEIVESKLHELDTAYRRAYKALFKSVRDSIMNKKADDAGEHAHATQ